MVKGQGGQSTGAAYIHFEDHASAKVGGLVSVLSCRWLAATLMLLHQVTDTGEWGPLNLHVKAKANP